MWVDLGQREVPEDEAYPVAESVQQVLDDWIGLTAGRALVVAVLDQRDQRRFGAQGVVGLPDRDDQPCRCYFAGHGVFSFAVRVWRAVRMPSAPGTTPTGET